MQIYQLTNFMSKISYNPDLVGRVIKSWLPWAIMITLISATVYMAAQQTLRLSANDPQVEYAEDLAAQLADGEVPDASLADRKIDIAKSLGTYIMIVSKDNKVLFTTGELDGKEVTPPEGVLTAAKDRGQNRVTWQPAAGVRTAIVVNYYNGKNTGYVIVGKSLREVEQRTTQVMWQVAAAWGLMMLISLLIAAAPAFPTVTMPNFRRGTQTDFTKNS